eukprot:13445920-Ditylum_brightwellii.AAC.1
MTRTERENVKTSLSHITRDVMVWENITKASQRKIIVTIMAFVTVALTSATLCKPAGSTFSPHTILRNSRGSGRSSFLRALKGGPKGQPDKQRG